MRLLFKAFLRELKISLLGLHQNELPVYTRTKYAHANIHPIYYFTASIGQYNLIFVCLFFLHFGEAHLSPFLYLEIWSGGVCLWTGCGGDGGSCCDGALSGATGYEYTQQKDINKSELHMLCD